MQRRRDLAGGGRLPERALQTTTAVNTNRARLQQREQDGRAPLVAILIGDSAAVSLAGGRLTRSINELPRSGVGPGVDRHAGQGRPGSARVSSRCNSERVVTDGRALLIIPHREERRAADLPIHPPGFEVAGPARRCSQRLRCCWFNVTLFPRLPDTRPISG